MKREDAARLLGPPGQLSRIEKEAILERLEGARHTWYRRHRTSVMAAAFAVTAAAAAVVVIRPSGTSGSSETSGLTARGSSEVPLVIRCGDREPGQCQIGDRLAFDFGITPPAGFVAVFARAESGKVIWYVPSGEDTASVALAEHTVVGVLDSVAVIDGTYAPGRYEVFAVMSPRPLQRAEIRGFAQGDRLIAPPGIRIDTRSFVIRSEEKVR